MKNIYQELFGEGALKEFINALESGISPDMEPVTGTDGYKVTVLYDANKYESACLKAIQLKNNEIKEASQNHANTADIVRRYRLDGDLAILTAYLHYLLITRVPDKVLARTRLFKIRVIDNTFKVVSLEVEGMQG